MPERAERSEQGQRAGRDRGVREFFKEPLAEAAQAHGDSLTAQLLRESGVDSARSNAWTSALAAYAVAQRTENLSVLDKWIEKWRPAAERATDALKEVLP